jgi:integrase
VLKRDFGWLDGLVRAPRRPRGLPVVLTREEVIAVAGPDGRCQPYRAELLYGSGLRLMECLTLRVKDVEFEKGQLTVRRGKGAKDRVTMLSRVVQPGLRAHLEEVKLQHLRTSGGEWPYHCPRHWNGKVPGGNQLALVVGVPGRSPLRP